MHEIDTTTVTKKRYYNAIKTIVRGTRDNCFPGAEWQNKSQLQYSRVAEGKNCEAQNSNFCVNFCALLSHSYRILSMLHLYEPKGRARV